MNINLIGLENVKGKAVPLQAWSGPESSRKLRFPYFMTTAQDGGKVVSLTHRPSLPSGNTPGTHFCLRLSRPQGHSATGRISSLKNSNDTIGNRTRDLPVCSVVSKPISHLAPPTERNMANLLAHKIYKLQLINFKTTHSKPPFLCALPSLVRATYLVIPTRFLRTLLFATKGFPVNSIPRPPSMCCTQKCGIQARP
jgi:hypothetical protein